MLGCVTGAAGRSADLVRSQTCLQSRGLMIKLVLFLLAFSWQAGRMAVGGGSAAGGWLLNNIASAQLTQN